MSIITITHKNIPGSVVLEIENNSFKIIKSEGTYIKLFFKNILKKKKIDISTLNENKKIVNYKCKINEENFTKTMLECLEYLEYKLN